MKHAACLCILSVTLCTSVKVYSTRGGVTGSITCSSPRFHEFLSDGCRGDGAALLFMRVAQMNLHPHQGGHRLPMSVLVVNVFLRLA